MFTGQAVSLLLLIFSYCFSLYKSCPFGGVVECQTCNREIVDSIPGHAPLCGNLGQVINYLCASVTKQYDLVLVKGWLCPAAGKVPTGLAGSNGRLPSGP